MREQEDFVVRSMAPDPAQAAMAHALLESGTGHPDIALATLQTAGPKYPRHVSLQWLRATLEHLMGRREDARASYSRILRIPNVSAPARIFASIALGDMAVDRTRVGTIHRPADPDPQDVASSYYRDALLVESRKPNDYAELLALSNWLSILQDQHIFGHIPEWPQSAEQMLARILELGDSTTQEPALRASVKLTGARFYNRRSNFLRNLVAAGEALPSWAFDDSETQIRRDESAFHALLDEAFRMCEASDNFYLTNECLETKGAFYFLREQWAQGLEHYSQAYSNYSLTKQEARQANTAAQAAICSEMLGDPLSTSMWCNRALNHFLSIGGSQAAVKSINQILRRAQQGFEEPK